MSASNLLDALRKQGFRPVDLARALSVDKGTVTKWHSGRVPAERVLDVERITGIPRHDLRPDLYPREPSSSERAA
jgi:DNA-binding transcriptional regulator YdaS (Cro superfamily)